MTKYLNKQLKEGQVYFGSQLEILIPHRREDLKTGAWDSWLHFILSKEAEMNACAQLSSYSVQFRAPAHGIRVTTHI